MRILLQADLTSLFFADDIAQMDTVANALSGINCDANGIAVIRLAFFDATDTHLVDDQFPGSDHQATVAGIPAGNNRRVVVTAEDQRGAVILRGEERNITIRKNRVTEGSDIAMTPVSSGDQGNVIKMMIRVMRHLQRMLLIHLPTILG
jgi:hypothetical protein